MHVDGAMKTKPRPVDEAKQGHVSFFNGGDCEHRQTVRINPALNLLDAPHVRLLPRILLNGRYM